MAGVEARTATDTDRDGAVSALASAFADDPMMSWMFRAASPSRDRLEMFFREIVESELAKGAEMTFVVGDGDGASVWRDVGDKGPSTPEVLRSAPRFARVFRSGLARTLRAVSAIDKAHPSEPHRYLFFVGVHQDHQGHGYGSALLAPVLERCDAEGIPAYLENSKPANEAFYVRHGFTPRGKIDLPKGAPPLMPMWREPRSA